jgi:hypothetical protein
MEKKSDATKEKTVGEEAIALQVKDDKIDSIELQRDIHKGSNSKKSFEEEIWEAVDRGKRDATIEGNFYIVVLFKKERHLQNIVRQYFFYRQSCPSPDFDQTVYKYHPRGDELEYLWTIPNNAACVFLPANKFRLPPEQLPLLEMVEAFRRGDLDKLAATQELLDQEDKPHSEFISV